jgi:hypothetical protein
MQGLLHVAQGQRIWKGQDLEVDNKSSDKVVLFHRDMMLYMT